MRNFLGYSVAFIFLVGIWLVPGIVYRAGIHMGWFEDPQEESRKLEKFAEEANERRLRRIDEAIMEHRLVVGMNEWSARKAIGTPYREIEIVEGKVPLKIWILAEPSASPIAIFRYGGIVEIRTPEGHTSPATVRYSGP